MDWSSMLWFCSETSEIQTGGRNYIQVDMLTNDSLPLLAFTKATPLPGGVIGRYTPFCIYKSSYRPMTASRCSQRPMAECRIAIWEV